MCDTGGPRCPSHARPKLRQARKNMQRIEREQGDDEDALERARRRLDEAQLEWDSTHPGLNDLSKRVETTTDPEKRAEYAHRLKAAFDKRLQESIARSKRECEEKGKGTPKDYMLIETTSYDPKKPDDTKVNNGPKLPVKSIYIPDNPRLPLSYEADSGAFTGRFYHGVKETKASTPTGTQVDLPSKRDLQGMRQFITRDGKSGVAMTRDGYITGVYSNSKYKGTAVANLENANQHGANRLDCFETYLPGIYGQAGYRTVSRIPFNDEYRPDGWDYSTYDNWNRGRPDVVFMVHERHFPEGHTDRSFNDYDDASAYARDLTRKD